MANRSRSSVGHRPASPIDLTQSSPSSPKPSKKRSRLGVEDEDAAVGNDLSIPSPKKLKKSPASSPTEKRLRVFRPKAPQTFYTVYERALGQRFYVLRRRRAGTCECPEEVLDLAGSTGNVYQVHVARKPRCTCPHAMAGNQCKHIIYVREDAAFSVRVALLS